MSGSTDQPAGAGDEVSRKFREALERKNAKSGDAHGAQGATGRGVGPASNDKTKRTFRRKSGG
jgi:adenylosuccinate synthase